MKKDLPITLAFVAAGVLAITTMISGNFNGFTFFGMVFYTIVWLLSRAYLKKSFEEHEEQRIREEQNKYKFDYCWNRVNEILVHRMNSSPLEWGEGVNRRSQRKDFFDGIQYRPFRSFEAKMKNTGKFMIVIYDINSDDIAEFDSRPDSSRYQDHFKGFNPYKRGASSEFGSVRDRRRIGYRRRSSRSKPRITVGFDDQDSDYEDFEASHGVDPAVIDKAAREIQGGGR